MSFSFRSRLLSRTLLAGVALFLTGIDLAAAQAPSGVTPPKKKPEAAADPLDDPFSKVIQPNKVDPNDPLAKPPKAVPGELPKPDVKPDEMPMPIPEQPGVEPKPGDEKKPGDETKPAGPEAPDMGEIDPKVKQGLDMVLDGKYNEAIDYFKGLVKSDPTLVTAHAALALADRLALKLDDALDEYNEAIRLSPDDEDLFFRRGIVWFYKDEFNIALADFSEALSFNERDSRVYLWTGFCYLEKGDLAKAIDNYSQAIKYDPTFLPAYNSRGLAEIMLGSYERAIDDFNHVIRLDSKNAAAYFKRGVAYARLGDDSHAIQSYTAALKVKPEFPQALYNRGLLYQRAGQAEQAKSDLDEAHQLDPDLDKHLAQAISTANSNHPDLRSDFAKAFGQ